MDHGPEKRFVERPGDRDRQGRSKRDTRSDNFGARLHGGILSLFLYSEPAGFMPTTKKDLKIQKVNQPPPLVSLAKNASF